MVKIGQLTVQRRDDEMAVITGPGDGPVRPVEYDAVTLRELIRWDDDGHYRPLSGARTLPGRWQVRCSTAAVEEALEVVYPLGILHRRQLAAGTLRVVPLEQTLARQGGRYEVAAALDAEGRGRVREVLCSQCVRTPVWAGVEGEAGGIPCPEACSVFVSLCREAAIWGRDRPDPGKVDGSVPWAAFDRPGNALREAYLAASRDQATGNGPGAA